MAIRLHHCPGCGLMLPERQFGLIQTKAGRRNRTRHSRCEACRLARQAAKIEQDLARLRAEQQKSRERNLELCGNNQGTMFDPPRGRV